MKILNILNDVIPKVSILTPPRPVILHIQQFSNTIIDGRYIMEPFKEVKYNAIIQQEAPSNVSKLSESTIDSDLTFKVYLLSKEPLIITSNSIDKIDYQLCFEDPVGSDKYYMHNIYSVKNYTMNGWIVCKVSRLNERLEYGKYKK